MTGTTHREQLVSYALKFRGTKLLRIANLLNIRGLHFCGC